jgi:GGDEF domain-containing protein
MRRILRPPHKGSLGADALRRHLSEEISRHGRDAAELALIAAKLPNGRELAHLPAPGGLSKLHAALGAALAQVMESCDRLGRIGSDLYVLVLPGLGLLKARLIAERVQEAFKTSAMTLAGQDISCVLSIVCSGRNSLTTSSDLLGRVRKGLSRAARDNAFHISQEAGTAVSARATLVHPDEKRFLFFGGH